MNKKEYIEPEVLDKNFNPKKDSFASRDFGQTFSDSGKDPFGHLKKVVLLKGLSVLFVPILFFLIFYVGIIVLFFYLLPFILAVILAVILVAFVVNIGIKIYLFLRKK